MLKKLLLPIFLTFTITISAISKDECIEGLRQFREGLGDTIYKKNRMFYDRILPLLNGFKVTIENIQKGYIDYPYDAPKVLLNFITNFEDKLNKLVDEKPEWTEEIEICRTKLQSLRDLAKQIKLPQPSFQAPPSSSAGPSQPSTRMPTISKAEVVQKLSLSRKRLADAMYAKNREFYNTTLVDSLSQLHIIEDDIKNGDLDYPNGANRELRNYISSFIVLIAILETAYPSWTDERQICQTELNFLNDLVEQIAGRRPQQPSFQAPPSSSAGPSQPSTRMPTISKAEVIEELTQFRKRFGTAIRKKNIMFYRKTIETFLSHLHTLTDRISNGFTDYPDGAYNELQNYISAFESMIATIDPDWTDERQICKTELNFLKDLASRIVGSRSQQPSFQAPPSSSAGPSQPSAPTPDFPQIRTKNDFLQSLKTGQAPRTPGSIAIFMKYLKEEETSDEELLQAYDSTESPKKNYQKLILLWHPDKQPRNKENQDLAEEVFSRLRRAAKNKRIIRED